MSAKPCEDHLGNKFKSIKDMCKFWKVSQTTYISRLKSGLTKEQALTYTKYQYKNFKNKIIDHLGKKYMSIKDMVEAYPCKKVNVLKYRLQKGWTLEKALTTPPDRKYNVKHYYKNKKYYDHLGNEYNSRKELLNKYNITYQAFKKRIKKWSLEKTLTTPVKEQIKYEKYYDHLGNEYKTLKELCSFWGITVAAYKNRKKTNMSLEQILTTPMKRKIKPITYNGKTYDKLTNFINEYEITMAQYYSRIKLGWSLHKIVNHKGNACFHSCEDHLGNKFDSIQDRNKFWNISNAMYQSRIANGWTLEESLTIPKNLYIGEYRVAECLKSLNIKFYHDVTIKTIFEDLKVNIDWSEFLTQLKSNLATAGFKWSEKKILKLRPDFTLYTDDNNKILGVIEFDGEQHQNFVEYFFKTIENFFKRNNADFIKQSLWEYMNLPMLRIRHDQIDNIEYMIKDFIANPENYIHNHNTYLSEEEYWSILTEQKEKLNLAFA